MTKLFDGSADVCLISAAAAGSENFAAVLLPAVCSLSNTGGGTVIIGAARAADGSVAAEGLRSISETRLLFEELVSDKTKISVNSVKTVSEIRENGKDFLKIEVAPAPWTERPVFINSDQKRGVYRYLEGERFLFSDKITSVMAKDSVDMQRDNMRLEHFAGSSVDLEALERYRKTHREKRPFPKWDMLDDESFMERIGAKSDGRLLRAGSLMFGEERDVSFCLRRVNNGTEEKIEAKNIWSFIELVLPVFESRGGLDCKNALYEAFFNSLIHADYSLGGVEALEGGNHVAFINSGIPRSKDNSSVCRNLRIMRMLCLVGYAKNKGMGMGLIKKYSDKSRLSEDYEKWQTEITIPITEAAEPAKIEPPKNAAPLGFYPVVELAKLETKPEEQIIADTDAAPEETNPEYGEFLIIPIPDETAETEETETDENEAEKPVISDDEEIENIEEPENIEEAAEEEVTAAEETEQIDANIIFEIPEEMSEEPTEPVLAEPEDEGIPDIDLKESEQGKTLERLVKEHRLKSVVSQNTAEPIPPAVEPAEPVLKAKPVLRSKPILRTEPVLWAEPEVTPESDDENFRQKTDDFPANSHDADEIQTDAVFDIGDENGAARQDDDIKTAVAPEKVQISAAAEKKRVKSRINTAKPKPLRVVMGNLVDDEEITQQRPASGKNKQAENITTDGSAAAVNAVRENSHASAAMIKDAVFEYCEDFRTIGEISSALMRPESSIKRHIVRMVKEGKLEVNENNAYRSVSGAKE